MKTFRINLTVPVLVVTYKTGTFFSCSLANLMEQVAQITDETTGAQQSSDGIEWGVSLGLYSTCDTGKGTASLFGCAASQKMTSDSGDVIIAEEGEAQTAEADLQAKPTPKRLGPVMLKVFMNWRGVRISLAEFLLSQGIGNTLSSYVTP